MKKIVLACLLFSISLNFATAQSNAPQKDKNGWLFLEHKPATNKQESGYGIYVNVNSRDQHDSLHRVIPVRLKFDKPSHVYGQDNVVNELALFSWDCNKHQVSVGMFNFWNPDKEVIASIGETTKYFIPPSHTLFDQVQKYACPTK